MLLERLVTRITRSGSSSASGASAPAKWPLMSSSIMTRSAARAASIAACRWVGDIVAVVGFCRIGVSTAARGTRSRQRRQGICVEPRGIDRHPDQLDLEQRRQAAQAGVVQPLAEHAVAGACHCLHCGCPHARPARPARPLSRASGRAGAANRHPQRGPLSRRQAAQIVHPVWLGFMRKHARAGQRP